VTEFDHTPTEPPNRPADRRGGDPSVDEVRHEPDEVDIERGSADGSARENPVLEESLEDAGDVTGRETHHDEQGGPDDPAVG
jgi:hypothetical protein